MREWRGCNASRRLNNCCWEKICEPRHRAAMRRSISDNPQGTAHEVGSKLPPQGFVMLLHTCMLLNRQQTNRYPLCMHRGDFLQGAFPTIGLGTGAGSGCRSTSCWLCICCLSGEIATVPRAHTPASCSLPTCPPSGEVTICTSSPARGRRSESRPQPLHRRVGSSSYRLLIWIERNVGK